MRIEKQGRRIWGLCLECGRSIYGLRGPSTGYALASARLLFGTACQESGLEWERQRGPQYAGRIGGFGKWQVEEGSLVESIAWLRVRPAVRDRCTEFVFNDPHAGAEWLDMGIEALEWALRMDDNDRLGVIFARVHYLRVADPIPLDVLGQAKYWKRWYNTGLGRGTVEEYLANWERGCGWARALVGEMVELP